MIEHRVVKCKQKKSKIAKVCEKMGLDGWEYAGSFYSRVFLFFGGNYLMFTRNSK